MYIPYELKPDKEGLLYTDNVDLRRRSPIILDTRDIKYEKYYQNVYYELFSTKKYIIKYCITYFTKKEIKAIKEMLRQLIEKQGLIEKTDFPIGYYKDGRRLAGQVIPYYLRGKSYDHVLETHNIEELKKYYHHDDDNIHNAFLMLEDVLDAVYEMFENNIYYTRFYSDDIVLFNNETKLIDFDHHNIKFDDKDKCFISIVKSYLWLLNSMLKSFQLSEEVNENLQSFEEAKRFTKQIENKVRKG